MIVYPAMDLMSGRVVRLRQGRFDCATAYSDDPARALSAFAEAGAEWAHVVDLDGARVGQPVQHAMIAGLAASAPIKLQVAGGFRTTEQLARMFDAGAARVVIGSLAITQPEIVRDWLDAFGTERVALSLDVRMVGDVPQVALAGWTEDSGQSLWDVAAQYPSVRHLLLTDIGRDGMLEGPNFALYEEASRRLPNMQIQASGGISSLEDLTRLSAHGAIVGRALWEGSISLGEAIGLARA
jgi:phosphoribosylformimino-5-aminoimidazole carboxamide ribotide isomerase